MKIRHPWLIKLLAFVGAAVLRLWMSTLRYRYRSIGPNVEPTRRDLEGRYIYAAWHENLLLLANRYARRDVRVLISQHADGEIIASTCRHLGWRPIRGSTTRGGIEAVRSMLRLGGKGQHLGLNPDGPRGPRRKVQTGLIYLASKTGLPIVPVGVGYRRPWRMRSWDRFAVPKPWSDAACVTGVPIAVPPNLDREQLEAYRKYVEDAINGVSEAAERLAETGKWRVSRDLLALLERPQSNGPAPLRASA